MITATLSPHALRDGCDLVVRVSGLVGLPTGPASVRLVRVDTIETGWVASVGSELRSDGTLEANWANVQLGRETAVHASSVEVAGGVHEIEASGVAVVNASALIVGVPRFRGHLDLPLVGRGEDAQEVSDVLVAGQWVGQRGVGVDRVAVASSVACARDVAGIEQLGNDAVRRAFGDPDA